MSTPTTEKRHLTIRWSGHLTAPSLRCRAPLDSDVMLTYLLRGTFYLLLALQVALIGLAFSWEVANEPAFLAGLVTTAGPWWQVSIATWSAVFLVAVVTIVRRGAISKPTAVFSLSLLVAAATAVAYLA